MKNYYLILGVDVNATQSEIKAAYRQQAKAVHPDSSGQESGPFIDLQEAYLILSDPARRRAYDKTLGYADLSQRVGVESPEPLIPVQTKPEPLIPENDPVDLGELSLRSSFHTIRPSFDELFERLGRNFSLFRPKVERLRSLSVEIRVSPREALRGGRVRLRVPAQMRCGACSGRGGFGFFECWRCEGAGVVIGEYPVSLSFPARIVDNYVVEIPLDRFGIRNFYLRAIFKVS